MAEQTRPLRDAAQTVLDAGGNGQVVFGPGRHGVTWRVRRVSVQTSTATRHPEARIYRDTVGDATFISGTFVGSLDTDDSLDEELHHGERLIVVWRGGDPGATATATWAGEETTL